MVPSSHAGLVSVDNGSIWATARETSALLSVPQARARRKAHIPVFSDTALLSQVVAA